jgi:four helix bundle protein
MSGFQKLMVWQKAHALTLRVYAATKQFPSDERFGLTSQVRRAAVSIGSNIAEGTGRNTPGELRQFLGIAMGSVHEIQYQIIVARDLGYLAAAEFEGLAAGVREVRAMLDAMRRRT